MKYETLQDLIKIWYEQIIYFTFVLNNIIELEGKVFSIYLILYLVCTYYAIYYTIYSTIPDSQEIVVFSL